MRCTGSTSRPGPEEEGKEKYHDVSARPNISHSEPRSLLGAPYASAPAEPVQVGMYVLSAPHRTHETQRGHEKWFIHIIVCRTHCLVPPSTSITCSSFHVFYHVFYLGIHDAIGGKTQVSSFVVLGQSVVHAEILGVVRVRVRVGICGLHYIHRYSKRRRCKDAGWLRWLLLKK